MPHSSLLSGARRCISAGTCLEETKPFHLLYLSLRFHCEWNREVE
jgi:hypothetical protein